jgi:hypothetical protein
VVRTEKCKGNISKAATEEERRRSKQNIKVKPAAKLTAAVQIMKNLLVWTLAII